MRAILKSPLFVTLAIVLLGVFTQSLQLFDHMYWNVWFKNREHIEQNQAVIVSLDNGKPVSSRSVAASLSQQAELVDRLVAAGASHIYLDVPSTQGEDAVGDTALQDSIRNAGSRITLVYRSKVVIEANRSVVGESPFAIPAGTSTAASAWNVNFLGFATGTDGMVRVGNNYVPAVAVLGMSGTEGQKHFYPKFAIDPAKIQMIDASRVLNDGARSGTVAGKTVFVTNTNMALDTVLGYFGGGRKVPAAVVDIAGIEGAKAGEMRSLGWIPLLAFIVIGLAFGTRLRKTRYKATFYPALLVTAMLAPGLLRENGILLDLAPAMCAMLVYVPLRFSQKWRSRVQMTNSASGLPNISAMAAEGVARSLDVIAVSVSQYEQMLASLPRELHGECARQIARRISLGAGDRQVYDNDNGHFVWLENSRTLDVVVEHLEGLRALFSSPLVIGGHVLDTTVHFGIDRNVDSKPMSRIQSALASANEAQSKSKLYEEFGEQRLAQSPWELSLHARIDEGLRNGDIWLALQPQYDFRHNRISGAEALIRWTDPERGAIPPDAFILQAERAGRIEAITYWVLEKSIAMLGQLNAVAAPFQISVNLSARMVDHPGLVHRVADIVRETGLQDCSAITFEVTETFSMANREQAKVNLAALRTMGFRLSIDDFGTGQASLAYLAEIPSDEIKLDRRFIKSIAVDERDRLIVESVIGLAHSLGQEVVAEGIEDIVTLETLRRLGCDLAQGYHIGRPMRLPELLDLVDLSQGGTAHKAKANS
jgi:EAL domain-containing protein (putative c-di-GMP-specific phosphodiesterase class I)